MCGDMASTKECHGVMTTVTLSDDQTRKRGESEMKPW